MEKSKKYYVALMALVAIAGLVCFFLIPVIPVNRIDAPPANSYKYWDGKVRLLSGPGMTIPLRTIGEIDDEYEYLSGEIIRKSNDEEIICRWFQVITERMQFDAMATGAMRLRCVDSEFLKINLRILRDSSRDRELAGASIFSGFANQIDAVPDIIDAIENRVPDSMEVGEVINQRGDNRWRFSLYAMRYALGMLAGRGSVTAREYIENIINEKRQFLKSVKWGENGIRKNEQYQEFAELLIYSPNQWGLDLLKVSEKYFKFSQTRSQMIRFYLADSRGDDIQAYQEEIFLKGALMNKYGTCDNVRTLPSRSATNTNREVEAGEIYK